MAIAERDKVGRDLQIKAKYHNSVLEAMEDVHRIDRSKLIQQVSNWKIISMLAFLLSLGIGILAVHYIIMGG